MILHRFCSKAEYDKFMAGETLVNDTDHGARRGYAVSTSVGFCFFAGDPEDWKHRLSGIVDFDVCITVEAPGPLIYISTGRYPVRTPDGRLDGLRFYTEFCTRTYNNRDFKLLKADTSFSSYYPGPAKLREMYPMLYDLFGIHIETIILDDPCGRITTLPAGVDKADTSALMKSLGPTCGMCCHYQARPSRCQLSKHRISPKNFSCNKYSPKHNPR